MIPQVVLILPTFLSSFQFDFCFLRQFAVRQLLQYIPNIALHTHFGGHTACRCIVLAGQHHTAFDKVAGKTEQCCRGRFSLCNARNDEYGRYKRNHQRYSVCFQPPTVQHDHRPNMYGCRSGITAFDILFRQYDTCIADEFYGQLPTETGYILAVGNIWILFGNSFKCIIALCDLPHSIKILTE